MKCFNCGKETDAYLCPKCRTEEILNEIFEQIRFYKPETCKNPYLAEYVATLTEERAERNCIPAILALFPAETAEYYQCLYFWIRGMEEFEAATEHYLAAHDWAEAKSQMLISCLLKKHIRNDFVKPRVWCDWIAEADNICCELYSQAAMYFAMIAEYDLADKMAEKGLACDRFLYSTKEYMQTSLEEQKVDTLRYRTKKPYWPKTEERRRAVAMFYDEKGIAYPRIESKPKKVDEDKFEPIKECIDAPEDYCAFWCAEAFSISASKPIYQIAAVKVQAGKITDEFQSFVRPWDANKASRQSAAKEAGVPLSVIEGAEDVDQVMVKFFDFVGDAVLMSTDALGNQKNLLCRATRYAGMKRLPNELYDLLDFAGEIDSKFGFMNRTELLKAFSFAEGTDSIGKAKANIVLYEALKNFGD